jgi:ribosomal protein S18 acetylase RimI-like enzyme
VESPGDGTVIKEYQPAEVASIAGELRVLYADVYAEPPYYETESDVINFEARLAQQVQEPSCLLIAAWYESRLAGYIYGFAINRDSPLWATVFLSPDPDQHVQEWTHPVVFVSELLVAARYRHRGIARALHDRFLAARGEPKAVLLAHPDATAAQSAYRRWGWYRVGAGRPFPDTTLYDTLVKDLPAAGTVEQSLNADGS